MPTLMTRSTKGNALKVMVYTLSKAKCDIDHLSPIKCGSGVILFLPAKADNLRRTCVSCFRHISKFLTILQYLPFSTITMGTLIHER